MRGGVGGVVRDTLRFLRKGFVPPKIQMDPAERKAALFQRLRAKRAADKVFGVTVDGSSSAPKWPLEQEPASGGQPGPDQWTAKRRIGVASEEQLQTDATESGNEAFGHKCVDGLTRPGNRCAELTGSFA